MIIVEFGYGDCLADIGISVPGMLAKHILISHVLFETKRYSTLAVLLTELPTANYPLPSAIYPLVEYDV